MWARGTLSDNTKSQGRTVKHVGVDKRVPARGQSGRWRDKVVESIWGAIEESMRLKGWNKKHAPK
jgi:parafibromin